MSFSMLVVRNLFRQRVRTTLTLLGIMAGIATVVALGVITEGLKAAGSGFATSGGADFMLAQEGASDLFFSTVSEAEWQEIALHPDVERATGVLFEVAEVGSNPYFLAFGYDAGDLVREPLELVAGRRLAPLARDETMLGVDAAAELGKSVGDTVELENTVFRVVGVYRAGQVWRDGGAIVPLERLQELAHRPDAVTAIHVTVAPRADPAAVAAAIEDDHAGLAAIRTAADFGEVDQGYKMLDAANLAISLLAVGIGAIGVMNTMIMSVYERTREIGVLRAVGWRGRRILRLIVSESLFLCLLAAGVGIGAGLLAAQAVLLVPSVGSFLVLEYSPVVFARALAVGVLVALAGALYPALRAVRLSPMEALRHE